MRVTLTFLFLLLLTGCQSPFDHFQHADTTLTLATPSGYKPAVPIGQMTWEEKASAALALAEPSAAASEALPPPAITAKTAARPAVKARHVRRALSNKARHKRRRHRS